MPIIKWNAKALESWTMIHTSIYIYCSIYRVCRQLQRINQRSVQRQQSITNKQADLKMLEIYNQMNVTTSLITVFLNMDCSYSNCWHSWLLLPTVHVLLYMSSIIELLWLMEVELSSAHLKYAITMKLEHWRGIATSAVVWSR